MRSAALIPVVSLLLACSADGGGRGSASGGVSGEGSAEGSASAEEGSGSAEGDGDGEQGDGDGEQGDGDGEQGDGDGDGEGGMTKWDVLGVPDAAPCAGGMGGDDPEFSYIWVADSSQNAISKINTETLIEEGRYYTRPDHSGSPSRTSVNLQGDVAVANRSGGVTKFYAKSEDCQEQNGQNGIQTSTGKNDLLTYAIEECHAWHAPMNYASQRPVAWTPGTYNNQTCGYEDEKVWTAGTSDSSVHVDILLLNGEDGSVEEKITVQGLNSGQWGFYGLYGAASDGDGNMFSSQLGSAAKMIRVDIDDMSYEIWNNPAAWHWYGMTVDSDGYMWVCSSTGPARYDYEKKEWKTAMIGGYTGCMADSGDDGLLWMSTGQGVQGVNRETLMVEKSCPNTNGSYGISIDFKGNVWAVASGSNANRVNPDTCQTDTYPGLTGAYTYSDMTGFALANAGTPSG